MKNKKNVKSQLSFLKPVLISQYTAIKLILKNEIT